MDCSQTNAGLGSCDAGGTGTGTGTISYDSDTRLLSWDVSWSGLSGDLVAAHFHGPATTSQEALVQLNMFACCGGTGSMDTATLSPEQASQLLLELWYVNVHTTTFQQGEIRGQVLRVTGVPALSGWGIAVVALALTAFGMRVLRRPEAALASRHGGTSPSG